MLVIGAGGLGCPVLQYIAAAGVGTIGIVDFDLVEASNLQRQILYGTKSLGKNKALEAKKHLENLNDEITIVAYPFRLEHKNALSLFSEYDIIVDGTDNFATRYLVNDAAIITNKPLVYGAIYKFEGQVTVFNYNNGASYRCLFPQENTQALNCSQIGVLGVLPGIIGTMQANEVLKLILEIGDVLSQKLLCYNALNCSMQIISYSKNEAAIAAVLNNKANFKHTVETATCLSSNEIEAETALALENTLFVDVREPHEEPKLHLDNLLAIPLHQLEDNIHKIDTTKRLLFFCASGVRSLQAIQLLKLDKNTETYSIKNGIKSLLKYIKNEKIES